MALQGIYNFKGIELNDAYLKVQNVACSKNSIIRENLVSEAEYGENGEVTKEAQWEKQEEYTYDGNARVLVYKDKQTREKSFRESVTNFNLPFVIKVDEDSKNAFAQAYEALKSVEEYKDHTNV